MEEKRDQVIRARVSQSELRAAVATAKLLGLRLSDYVRFALWQTCLKFKKGRDSDAANHD